VHDSGGNIKSMFTATSSVGAQQMMTPGDGYLVSEVHVHELKLPAGFQVAGEEDAKQLRESMKRHRVDTSTVRTLRTK
jgi:hypothetical protein